MANEELLALKKQLVAQGITKEDIQAHLSGQSAQQPTQQSQIPDLTQFQQPQQSASQLVGNFMTRLGGGKPEDGTSDLAKLYQQEAIKSHFDKGDYVVSYDKEGKPVFTQAPGAIKNQPFYATQQGGSYYGAKTGQAGAQGAQAKTETELMEMVKKQIQDALKNQSEGTQNPSSNPIIPGTKVQAGPISIPLNPELTESEARSFGTLPVLNDAVTKFTALAQKGTLEDPNQMSAAGKGFAVDKGWAPLTFGQEDLSSMQAELNRIKANTLFAEGGKTLTTNERQVIENLFSTSGKDKGRIINDVQEGVRKYSEFVAAKRGGMMGYQPNQSSKGGQIDDVLGVL